MKGYDNWNHRPYYPANQLSGSINPYICRLAPGKDHCEIEWLGDGESFQLQYSERGKNSWNAIAVEGHEYLLEGLEENTEYELLLTDSNHRNSNIRLLRTGSKVGIIVNYLHPEDKQYGFSGQYLCSPSLLLLPDGTLLASMDVFASNAPQNLTLLFRSDDDGLHWHYVTDIFPCFWGKMFWHQNKLFMLGVSREYGDLLIGCSSDYGISWSAPAVILRGSSFSQENGNHRAPTVILKSHGRLWTGTEYGSWSKKTFAASLLSIDEQADPMVSSNWTLTDFVKPCQDWPDSEAEVSGGIEGNAVELPDGTVVDILRYSDNKALILKAEPNSPEEAMSFNKIIHFPVGHTKFEIVRHCSGVYYALGNPSPGRNILALYSSDDCITWTKVKQLINHSECSIKEAGFQYPVFCFRKNEILLLSRTAWNHAHNFHDSNFITFHKTDITQ